MLSAVQSTCTALCVCGLLLSRELKHHETYLVNESLLFSTCLLQSRLQRTHSWGCSCPFSVILAWTKGEGYLVGLWRLQLIHVAQTPSKRAGSGAPGSIVTATLSLALPNCLHIYSASQEHFVACAGLLCLPYSGWPSEKWPRCVRTSCSLTCGCRLDTCPVLGQSD